MNVRMIYPGNITGRVPYLTGISLAGHGGVITAVAGISSGSNITKDVLPRIVHRFTENARDQYVSSQTRVKSRCSFHKNDRKPKAIDDARSPRVLVRAMVTPVWRRLRHSTKKKSQTPAD
jgi:predicted ATP-grasp superfamily ATP-dependent carboligase